MLSAQTHLTARYLDLLSLRQRVTAENIANADTPGYRTLGFDFRQAMAAALTSPDGESAFSPTVRETGGLAVKNDGNDVDLEGELRTLGETAVRFSYALLLLRGGIRSVRSAIHEGRG